MAYGQSGHFALCFQQSFGTSFTDSAFFIPLISENIGEKINQLTENNMYGRLSESPYHEGTHEITGDLRTEAHPLYLGTLLKAALGQVTSTLQTSAYLHEFTPLTNDWDAFAATPPTTLEIHRDVGSAFIYSDLLANNLTLEIAHGQLLSTTLGFLGGGFTRSSPSTTNYQSGRPWSWEVVSASYDGTGQPDFRQINVIFENQLTGHFTFSGSNTPYRIKRDGPQKVSIEGTFLMQDQTLLQEYLDQSEKRLLVSFTGESLGGSEMTILTVDVPRLRFTELAPQLSGPGQLEVSFSGVGMVDTTSNYALRITLTNTQPSY